ncbi:MAG: IS630 family transposase [Firmicutes bacterium]|nr:IS630 family transposase [Bacillota bacterium]
MAAPRTKPPLVLTPEDRAWLERLAHSRTAPRQAVERAQILLAYADGASIWAIHRTTGFSTRKVRRCVDLALEAGPQAALADRPRPGRPRQLTPADRAWIIGLACQKPTAFGYAQEWWTQRLLAAHIRQTAEAAGHPAAAHLSPGTVAKLLKAHALHPHRVQYYLERRDPEFDAKMVRVLHVSQQVEFAFDGERPTFRLSYDEKPGIQAIGTTAPDRPPQPGGPAGTWQRDHEYQRFGTVSLLAGIDLATGEVIGLVRDRHRSREFVEFLQALDAKYDPAAKIQIVLDNHSAHTSRETQAYLASRPNRFEFVFTPKHGSWLNLIEVFFAKLSKVFLRHLRVQSQAELVARLEQYLAEINEHPVPFRWRYKRAELDLPERSVI